MRGDRILSILLLLQTRKALTAGELAAQLEVSERTILRDMATLSGAGVPVTATRGKNGGWRLLQPYRTNLTGLNIAESQTLFVPVASQLLRDLGLGKAAEAARIKMSASLSEAARGDAERVRERIHIDGGGWFPSSESFPLLPLLQDAVWQQSELRFSYERGDGEVVERTVLPLGLVAKGRVWYLVAQTETETLSYRVSRVRDVTETGSTFDRPADFCLAEFWEHSVAQFKKNVPRHPVVARVSPRQRELLRRAGNPPVRSETEPDDGRWVTLTLLFEPGAEAIDYVLRAGDEIEVLEPETLRGQIYDLAERLLTRYAPAK
ncbi:MAG: YafY family transcriptional regulator [Akkermansiaceae bacterium]|nr:YafY family transcriptional regulator [Armatimonadota bacterium]